MGGGWAGDWLSVVLQHCFVHDRNPFIAEETVTSSDNTDKDPRLKKMGVYFSSEKVCSLKFSETQAPSLLLFHYCPYYPRCLVSVDAFWPSGENQRGEGTVCHWPWKGTILKLNTSLRHTSC